MPTPKQRSSCPCRSRCRRSSVLAARGGADRFSRTCLGVPSAVCGSQLPPEWRRRRDTHATGRPGEIPRMEAGALRRSWWNHGLPRSVGRWATSPGRTTTPVHARYAWTARRRVGLGLRSGRRALALRHRMKYPDAFEEGHRENHCVTATRRHHESPRIAPRRLGNGQWQVSGLIAALVERPRRLPQRPMAPSGLDVSIRQDADLPLRGSHGFSPCSLFSLVAATESPRAEGHQPPC